MIHVDVRRDKNTGDYRVETSIDGSAWTLQYLLGKTVGDTDGDVRLRAEDCARAFAYGCYFASGEKAKQTSGGYIL